MRIALFKKKINLQLYYQVKELIQQTTKASIIMKEDTFGWEAPEKSLTEEYDIMYLGEFLSSLSQKGLNTFPEMRAVALAVADCYDLITENMHNNNQLSDFIQTVYACCESDIYLLVAAYKLVKNPKVMLELLEEIKQVKLKDLADNFFVVMEFDE